MSAVSVCAGLQAAEFWVSPSGDDAAAGSFEQPLATLDMAVRRGREVRRLAKGEVPGGVHIVLRGGVYRLEDTVRIRPEDSGTVNSPTVIEAALGEVPILSGGEVLSGWRKLDHDVPGLPVAARGEVWEADAPEHHGNVLTARQLWVGQHKGTRARTPNGEAMQRLLKWERPTASATIPLTGIEGLSARRGLEMVILQMWEIAILRVKAIRPDGDRAVVTFHQPEARVQAEHPWPQPSMNEGNTAPYYLTGLVEFLDTPGEWAQDAATGKIYYWPRPGEDMQRVDAVVPRLAQLLEVYGSVDRPVAELRIKGVEFRHASWTRPGEAGHVPLQAGMAMVEAYKLRPAGTADWRSLDNQAWLARLPAGVVVRGARQLRVENCVFEAMAASGLDVVAATQDGLIQGCLFRDLGGNGLQMGNFQDGPDEAHLPYKPKDERDVCARIQIANNRVTDVANEDWGCVGIGVGFAREVAVEHNDISNVSYTGVSLGWGWTRTENCMRDNRVVANRFSQIATRMADTAAVYTLSAQAGTVIRENYVGEIKMGPYVHDPAHWFYLYLDEGSSNITVRDNWCPAEKFLKNANGPGNVWENNGPQVSEAIQQAAGLEAEYRALLER